MTPNISARTAVLYNKRLLNSDPATLTPDDLSARTALIFICSILGPDDVPSAECMYARVVSEYHATWLRELPRFSYVGYLQRSKDFFTGEPTIRLWLLSDWLSSAEGEAKRNADMQQRHEEWRLLRVRWYRLRRRLMDYYEIGTDAAQAQIESHYAVLHCKIEAARIATARLLNILGFDAPITSEDENMYDDGMRHARIVSPSHAHAGVIDFSGMP